MSFTMVATLVFYVSGMCLGHHRLEQLGRPYPAITSVCMFTVILSGALLLDALFPLRP